MALSLFVKSMLSGMPRAVLMLCVILTTVNSRASERLEFNRDVRPILSDNCFFCHGPDAEQRQAGLRLDLREDALAAAAFLPGVPDESLLVQRILSDDPDELMPPPDSHKKLTSDQKETLRRWIAEGAEYQLHWAFVAPVKPDLPPESAIGSNIQNPIDNFIRAKLGEMGLSPSPAASRESLIRRVTLDLTGLPPTPDEVDAFLHDSAANAYERVVDRLLASPHFGERMAVDWLDAARYADTNGYQVDRDRELWPWRDWVIRAFNDNMPFDRFTIEQLAGDLLPGATLAQRIATGFHRNHMLNEEGGILEDEFLAEYTADRVETTATVWLGQTFNCARCHDHKFDPFTQRDFYAMKAFFHNVPERGVGDYSSPIRRNAPPFVRLPAPDIESRIAELQSKLPESECPSPAVTEEELETLKKQIAAAELEIPTTLVMEEMNEPRSTYILLRGAYDRLGDVVTAATPAVLPELDDNLPRNRLGLAQWLVSKGNPLTARVTVNRLWQQVFGTGLVRTSEDFGSQGELPSHPELLDWLAVTFRESGWNVKHLLRLLVTSATYRQQSHLSPILLEIDPDNRLLARGPRLRLMAEFVRDQALAASGLLTGELGGPSVKPYHPPGLYEQVTSGSGYNVYVAGKGDELRRRSLYTYWKRSVPHPAMLLFDAPFRETCTLRRPTSNTPLQALNLLNDPTYVEAARFLAARMMGEGGSTIDSRLTHGFRLLLARPPRPRELEVLRAAFDRAYGDFQNDPEAANAFLAVGEMGRAPELGAVELSAYSLVAATLMNLDETVMKE
jgi:hypothetical protein